MVLFGTQRTGEPRVSYVMKEGEQAEIRAHQHVDLVGGEL